jgi:hypothetical protein
MCQVSEDCRPNIFSCLVCNFMWEIFYNRTAEKNNRNGKTANSYLQPNKINDWKLHSYATESWLYYWKIWFREINGVNVIWDARCPNRLFNPSRYRRVKSLSLAWNWNPPIQPTDWAILVPSHSFYWGHVLWDSDKCYTEKTRLW